jgi:CBS domain containing-hemolysin-like protein
VDWELIVVFVCLSFSFLFSASETALTSLGRLEIQDLLDRGGFAASMAKKLSRDPSRVLITIILGNNVCNITAASVLTLWVYQSYPQWVVPIVGGFIFFLLFATEIVPKLIARKIALFVAPFAMRFLQFIDVAARPLIWFVTTISGSVVRALGLSSFDIRRPMGEEEISHTIELAAEEGGIDKMTGEVLGNLIDFSDRVAKDVMSPRTRISAVSVSWSQEDVLRYFSTDKHSRYPVYRNDLDDIVGFLLVKDLLNHIYRGQKGSWTRAIRKPFFVSELGYLGDILRDMKRWGTHLALVRNELGVVTGLLTLEDLIEEIVGEIRDETDDPSDAGMETSIGGPIMVSGEMPIVDFNERFDVAMPMDTSYSTLNGYILYRCGGIMPAEGTMLIDEDITLRVVSIDDNGIAKLQVIELSNS